MSKQLSEWHKNLLKKTYKPLAAVDVESLMISIATR